MIDTVLFDVDGTMMDTEYIMTHSLQQTLKELKGLDLPAHELEFILGIPGQKAVEQYADYRINEEVLLKEWDKNIQLLQHHARLFDGIKELLVELKHKNYLLGIVTSKTHQEMKNEFDHFNLNSFFDCVITASDTVNHKPHPEPIETAIEKLKKSPENVIYVGDSIYDMECAKQSKVAFALAEWGAKANNQFSEADTSLEKPSDLISYLSR